MTTNVRIIRESDDSEPLVAVVLLDEVEVHPVSGEVYPVLYVGYGDDVMLMCTMAWIDEQDTIDEIAYDGDTDFESVYNNIIVKVM